MRVHLPRRYRLATEMNLLYSLDQHGISLSTLYRQSKNTKGPVVLVVKDADDNVSFFFLKKMIFFKRYEKPGIWGVFKRDFKSWNTLLWYRRMVKK